VNHLPVAYFSNLTSLFPRSPLSAQHLLGRFAKLTKPQYRSFYGKSAGLGAPNDALYLWDRWLGADRDHPAIQLGSEQFADMRRFFAAAIELYQRPLVNKNNNLVASADLVADCLPRAHFICLTRQRRSLARSLYQARCEIHGSPAMPYGLSSDAKTNAIPQSSDVKDPVKSVCEQVLYLERLGIRQCRKIGKERFWRVSYEDFCRDPARLVRRIADEILGDPGTIRGRIPDSFKVPNPQRIKYSVAEQIDAEFSRIHKTR
jgi:hypothetical protein